MSDPNWTLYHSEEGYAYWHNSETDESVWATTEGLPRNYSTINQDNDIIQSKLSNQDSYSISRSPNNLISRLNSENSTLPEYNQDGHLNNNTNDHKEHYDEDLDDSESGSDFDDDIESNYSMNDLQFDEETEQKFKLFLRTPQGLEAMEVKL